MTLELLNCSYMRVLGNGWQYTVYDLGNGRVLKKFHSPLKLYWVILKTIFPFRDDPLWKLVPYARSMKRKALHSKQIIKSGRIPAEMIGNAAFLNNLDFEQDKVQTLQEYFKDKTTEELKFIIDKFIAFNLKLLARGVIDKSFNITKNYGVCSGGEIVLIDIGEIFDDPKRIREQIGIKVWTKHYVAGCIEDVEARAYFVEQMEKNFGSYK